MNQQLLVSSFESVHEVEMKQYLIGKKPIGDYYLVDSFADMGCFIKDKHFVAVHFHYDEAHLMRSVSAGDEIRAFLESTDIVLGLMIKRGNASVNSLLKAYGIEKDDVSKLRVAEEICCPNAQGLNQLNTTALMTRMELYVPEHRWRNTNLRVRQSLLRLVRALEARLPESLKTWNKWRSGALSVKVAHVRLN